MSKQIEAMITCPSCRHEFKTSLYRTLWVEYPELRTALLNDEINSVTCPKCNRRTRLQFPFLCTNVHKEIAIWYEPYHDTAIDKDIELYAAKFGAHSFYAKAPRIMHWLAFKEKFLEMEIAADGRHPPRQAPSPAPKASMAGYLQSMKGLDSTTTRGIAGSTKTTDRRSQMVYKVLIAILILAILSIGLFMR